MSSEGKFYLVTGGSGFLGSNLVKALVDRGDRVRVLDNNSRGSFKKLGEYINKIDFVEADIRDRNAVFKATQNIDIVCHLSFINGTKFFYEIPDRVLEVGVKGALNTLDASIEHGVKEYILASSSEVYQTPEQIPTNENVSLSIPDPLNPRYSYAGGKLISEILAFNYGRDNFERTVVFRPHNVYGPCMGFEHVIPEFILRFCKKTKEQPTGLIDFEIQGDGTETRAFNYIKDFIQGLLIVIDSGKDQNIYHIGTEEEVAVGHLVNVIGQKMGREARIIKGKRPFGSTPRRCPDISKIKSLGYNPCWPLDRGLIETIEWYKQVSPA